MIKSSIQQEAIIFVTIYVYNIGALNIQILIHLKGEIDSNTVLLGVLIPC